MALAMPAAVTSTMYLDKTLAAAMVGGAALLEMMPKGDNNLRGSMNEEEARQIPQEEVVPVAAEGHEPVDIMDTLQCPKLINFSGIMSDRFTAQQMAKAIIAPAVATASSQLSADPTVRSLLANYGTQAGVVAATAVGGAALAATRSCRRRLEKGAEQGAQYQPKKPKLLS